MSDDRFTRYRPTAYENLCRCWREADEMNAKFVFFAVNPKTGAEEVCEARWMPYVDMGSMGSAPGAGLFWRFASGGTYPDQTVAFTPKNFAQRPERIQITPRREARQ